MDFLVVVNILLTVSQLVTKLIKAHLVGDTDKGAAEGVSIFLLIIQVIVNVAMVGAFFAWYWGRLGR